MRPDVPLVIGREASAGADVVVLETNVSRRHAKFLFANGKITVDDLDSMNGTEVRGRRVDHASRAPAVQHFVHRGDHRPSPAQLVPIVEAGLIKSRWPCRYSIALATPASPPVRTSAKDGLTKMSGWIPTPI